MSVIGSSLKHRAQIQRPRSSAEDRFGRRTSTYADDELFECLYSENNSELLSESEGEGSSVKLATLLVSNKLDISVRDRIRFVHTRSGDVLTNYCNVLDILNFSDFKQVQIRTFELPSEPLVLNSLVDAMMQALINVDGEELVAYA